jgi:hypothetical protein
MKNKTHVIFWEMTPRDRYQTTRYYDLEDQSMNFHHREKLISYLRKNMICFFRG